MIGSILSGIEATFGVIVGGIELVGLFVLLAAVGVVVVPVGLWVGLMYLQVQSMLFGGVGSLLGWSRVSSALNRVGELAGGGRKRVRPVFVSFYRGVGSFVLTMAVELRDLVIERRSA
jgi:hypothetical protein